MRLFDIGDGATAGSTMTVLPPVEPGGTFSNCTGAGVANGRLTNCQINANPTYNARWQTISVPIPSTYTCTDASNTGCGLRLQYFLGAGSAPNDTSSWTASIQGDPVRLVSDTAGSARGFLADRCEHEYPAGSAPRHGGAAISVARGVGGRHAAKPVALVRQSITFCGKRWRW